MGRTKPSTWPNAGRRLDIADPVVAWAASKSDINNMSKFLGMSTRKEFWTFSYTVVCIYSFCYIYVGWKQPTLIELSENTQSTELYCLKAKNVSFFEDTKNGPIIMTLLLLNHRIDVRCD